MKRLSMLVLLGSFVALALTACNQFIPPQQLNNPLGLNNQSLTLTNPPTTSSLAPQAPANVADFGGSRTFQIQDADLSGVPGWATPHGFSTAIDASGVKLQTSNATTFPASMTVVRTQVSLTVSDPQGPTVTWTHDTGTTAKQLLLLASSGSCVSTTSCSYTVKPGSDLNGALENVSLDSSQTGKLWTIIGSGASTDDVSLDVTLTLSSADSIPSSSMVITLDNAKGTLTFH